METAKGPVDMYDSQRNFEEQKKPKGGILFWTGTLFGCVAVMVAIDKYAPLVRGETGDYPAKQIQTTNSFLRVDQNQKASVSAASAQSARKTKT